MIYSIITALCLCIGFYFGFKIGSTKELPSIRRTIKENKQRDEEEKELKRFEKELGNLNRYDGTSTGQEDLV
jgi:hypothetical protein